MADKLSPPQLFKTISEFTQVSPRSHVLFLAAPIDSDSDRHNTNICDSDTKSTQTNWVSSVAVSFKIINLWMEASKSQKNSFLNSHMRLVFSDLSTIHLTLHKCYSLLRIVYNLLVKLCPRKFKQKCLLRFKSPPNNNKIWVLKLKLILWWMKEVNLCAKMLFNTWITNCWIK